MSYASADRGILYLGETFEPINNIVCESIEKIAVKILDPNYKTFILLSLYRAPNKNVNNSIKELRHILEIATSTKLPILLSGDLNIDLLRKDKYSNKAQNIYLKVI